MLLSGIALLLLGLVALNVLFYRQQPKMLFFPTRELTSTPQRWGLAYRDVAIHTDDGVTLDGWYVPAKGATRTLLFFHGNAGNISDRGTSLTVFHSLGLNVLMIDYRGYGRSDGTPDEAGLYRDARAAWRYLTDTRGVPADRIIVAGRSLGGAVATDLAARVRPEALVLESTFDSMADVARHYLPLISRLVRLRYRFDSAAKISAIRCPLLMLHSPDDDVIPFELGRKLFAAAPDPKHFVRLKGDHNSGFLVSEAVYRAAWTTFLDSLGDDTG